MESVNTLLNQTKDYYNQILSHGDPRVSEWAMMASPMPTFSIVALYLLVIHYGQKIMAHRSSGFEIRSLMVLYNTIMVCFSLYLVYEFSVAGWIFGGYTLGCQPVDRSMNPQALRMARACWLFYITKLIELVDTVFFVLRRKFKLITFLHVFHHSFTAISWWVGAKFVPGIFFFSRLNALFLSLI